MNFSRPLLTGFLCLALLGCADPVTLENFNRIKTGMSMTEVESILGGPGKSYEGIKIWRGRGNRTVIVEFDDRGLVVNQTRDGF